MWEKNMFYFRMYRISVHQLFTFFDEHMWFLTKFNIEYLRCQNAALVLVTICVYDSNVKRIHICYESVFVRKGKIIKIDSDILKTLCSFVYWVYKSIVSITKYGIPVFFLYNTHDKQILLDLGKKIIIIV